MKVHTKVMLLEEVLRAVRAKAVRTTRQRRVLLGSDVR
jgi:hypothetical protein